MFGPFVGSGIAGIAEDILLLAVQRRRHLIDIGFVGGRACDRVQLSPSDVDYCGKARPTWHYPAAERSEGPGQVASRWAFDHP